MLAETPLTVGALTDMVSGGRIVGVRQKAFDAMVRNRLLVAPPGHDIVIIDIDEKSLAARAAFDEWAARLKNFLDSAHEIKGDDAKRVDESYQPYGAPAPAAK